MEVSEKNRYYTVLYVFVAGSSYSLAFRIDQGTEYFDIASGMVLVRGLCQGRFSLATATAFYRTSQPPKSLKQRYRPNLFAELNFVLAYIPRSTSVPRSHSTDLQSYPI